jgi:hypothetical protein
VEEIVPAHVQPIDPLEEDPGTVNVTRGSATITVTSIGLLKMALLVFGSSKCAACARYGDFKRDEGFGVDSVEVEASWTVWSRSSP